MGEPPVSLIEKKPVIGQLVDLSLGMPEASHSRHKQNTETRQGI